MALRLDTIDLQDENKLAEKLITLSEIIVRKHFYASNEDKEDLVMIGVLKALKMIKSGNFDIKKGNLCTFLYTGMRNDMHNYLYHQNKFTTVDIDLVSNESGEEDIYFKDESCTIEYSLVHLECMHFYKQFGYMIDLDVVNELERQGFNVIGMSDKVKSLRKSIQGGSDLLKDKYGLLIKKDIIQRIIGLILWKKREEMEVVE